MPNGITVLAHPLFATPTGLAEKHFSVVTTAVTTEFYGGGPSVGSYAGHQMVTRTDWKRSAQVALRWIRRRGQEEDDLLIIKSAGRETDLSLGDLKKMAGE